MNPFHPSFLSATGHLTGPLDFPDTTREAHSLAPIQTRLANTQRIVVGTARVEIRTQFPLVISKSVADLDTVTPGAPPKAKKDVPWDCLCTAIKTIGDVGLPDDLYEATVDVVQFSISWLDVHWSAIQERQDLRVIGELQSRLQTMFDLIEASPQRSSLTLALIAYFELEIYQAACRSLELSTTWPRTADGRKGYSSDVVAFSARVDRFKDESLRLSGALEGSLNSYLLPCRRVPGSPNPKKNRPAQEEDGSFSGLSIDEAHSFEDAEASPPEDLGIDDDSSDDESDSGRPFAVEPPQGYSRSEAWDKLNGLIGLNSVKRNLHELIAYIVQQSRRKRRKLPELHLILSGNPGTGKTTVAALYSQLLKDIGLLEKGHCVIKEKSTLEGRYLGEAGTNTQAAIEEAQGGVLFIDEAHQLIAQTDRGHDYGRDIVSALVTAMENLRGKFVVVFAAYTSKVDKFLAMDDGLRSRVSEILHFPDYNDAELQEVLLKMADEQDVELEDGLAGKVARIIGRRRGATGGETFANAREIRQALDKAIKRQSSRVYKRARDSDQEGSKPVLVARDFKFLQERNNA